MADVRLDISQGTVSIVKANGTLGRSLAEGVGHVWNIEQAKHQAITYCVGYAALIAAGTDEAEAVRGADDDFENVAILIEQWLIDTTLNHWKFAAVDLMREPLNVAAVGLLAGELECRKHIDGDEIDVLFSVCDDDIGAEQLARYRAMLAADKTRG